MTISDVDADDAVPSSQGVMDLLLDPSFSENPHPVYERLRAECPVARQDSGGLFGEQGMVMAYRYEDVQLALHESDVYSSSFGTGELGLGNERPLIPLQIDPPNHKKYRALLDPLFAPRPMAALHDDITALANDLIDSFIERGECEYNSEFAVPFPCTVFLRLMGLPVEDLDHFVRIKEGIIRGGGELDLEKQRQARTAAAADCYAYFTASLDERVKSRRDDMLSHFLDVEVEGERLSREEILDICFLFLIAGLDTVTDSLGCFHYRLAHNPELRQFIVDNPDKVPAAVEELLRYETPVPGVARVATRDTELGGCPVKAGDSVMLSLGSANTDEAFMTGAGSIELERGANRHLAFGGGIHRCLGSHLARQELRIAVREWHRRIPAYHIPEGATVQWAPLLRQVEHLPLVFDEVRSE